jgi:hypothetical protein
MVSFFVTLDTLLRVEKWAVRLLQLLVLNFFVVRPRLDHLAGVAHDYLCGCAGCVPLKTTVTTCSPCKLSTHHAEQSTFIPLVGFPCVKSLADVNGAVIQALAPESSVNLAAKTVVWLV